MNYSAASISNLALARIGARGQITDINEGSPNAVKVLAVWDHVFQETLSERDWKFAKTRIALQQSSSSPIYGYGYAWAMPSDFLRFVRPHQRPYDHTWCWWPVNPPNQPSGPLMGWYCDPPFWPMGYAYVVETLTDGNRYALCNYDGSNGAVQINYIRLISDYTQLMPGFVNCLAWRLAAELAVGVTEDKAKFQQAEQMYRDTLNSAEAQNECMDFMEDESGSSSWERAGRWIR